MAAPRMTAGEMLAAVLDDLGRSVLAKEAAALADDPDAVHQLRTAVRRLRNVLAAFGDLVDPRTAGALRARLSAYGDRLGRVRDLEVRAGDVQAAAGRVGMAEDLADRLVHELRAQRATAHAALVAWCQSDEGEAVTTLLRRAGGVALVNGVGRPASVVACEVLVAQAGRALAAAEDYLDDEDAAHALRKDGRRVRHVADAVTAEPAAVLGDEARALGAAGAAIQRLLGEHRDAVLLAEHVRTRTVDEGADREAYAAVVEDAEKRAAAAMSEVPGAVAELAARREAALRRGGLPPTGGS